MTFTTKKILSSLDVQEDQQTESLSQQNQPFATDATATANGTATDGITHPSFGQVDMLDNDNIIGQKRSANGDGDETEDDDDTSARPEAKKLRSETIEDYVHVPLPDLPTEHHMNMETMGELDEKKGTDHSVIMEEDDDEAQGRIEGETIWDERFRMFLNFKKTFGHALIPKVYRQNKKLSSWVYRQRRHYSLIQAGKPSPLTEERIKKLEKAGFVWNTRNSDAQSEVEAQRRIQAQDDRWNATYRLLLEYKAKYGNCLVPKEYREVKGLASWVYLQRGLYSKFQKGQESTLTKERIQKLEDAGFVWKAKQDEEWQDKDRHRKMEMADDSWAAHYADLIAFKEKHGHTIVPKRYDVNQALSSWVFRQRRLYRLRCEGKKNGISDARLKKLQDVDFQFRIRATRTKKVVQVDPETESGAVSATIVHPEVEPSVMPDMHGVVDVNEGEIEAAVVAAVAAEEALDQNRASV